MNKKTVFFFLIIFIFSFVFGDISEAEESAGNSTSSNTTLILKIVEVNGFQVEILGVWGKKPNLFGKLFMKELKDLIHATDIIIESQGDRTFHYKDLYAMINQVKEELKSLYFDGGKFKAFKIKDREKK